MTCQVEEEDDIYEDMDREPKAWKAPSTFQGLWPNIWIPPSEVQIPRRQQRTRQDSILYLRYKTALGWSNTLLKTFSYFAIEFGLLRIELYDNF